MPSYTLAAIAVVVAALPSVSLAACPASIPPVIADITQVYNGGKSRYRWLISPTEQSNKAPDRITSCTPSYVGQYSDVGCVAIADRQKFAPVSSKDACEYSFTDVSGTRTMNLTVNCDTDARALKMGPEVNVVATGKGFTYSFVGQHSSVCGSDVPTTRPTPSGAVCPLKIPPVVAPVIQVYNGVHTPFNWTISPTQVAGVSPGVCSAAYISQHSNGRCDSTCGYRARAPTVVGSACEYSFTDGVSRFMDLRVVCDPSAKDLAVGPYVQVRGDAVNGNTFSFEGRFAGVCA